MPDGIKIAIADDQHLFRKGIISLLKQYKDYKVIVEASTVKELLKQLKLQKPELLLLNYKMHLTDNLATVEIIKKKYPSIKILILALYEGKSIIPSLTQKGANGFLLKGATSETMIEAIRAIKTEDYYFDKNFSKEMLKSYLKIEKTAPVLQPAMLTLREKEIIRLLCKELTNKEIGDVLFISFRTVEGYRASILRKINARNINGIVSYAVKNDLFND